MRGEIDFKRAFFKLVKDPFGENSLRTSQRGSEAAGDGDGNGDEPSQHDANERAETDRRMVSSFPLFPLAHLILVDSKGSQRQKTRLAETS